jgi:hypothetical protein
MVLSFILAMTLEHILRFLCVYFWTKLLTKKQEISAWTIHETTLGKYQLPNL